MTDRRFTILIVDDDADARLLMGAALRKAGFEVRLADNGEAGLAQFRAEPCDLVMLDVDMPGLSGHDVCATLRAEFGAVLPIVMVTGMDDVASVESAYLHGATDFIAKPVNWALIGHRVRYLSRGYQAMLDLRAAEARYAAILNAIPDVLFELDIDGRYIDYRAANANLLVAPAETLIGKTVRDVLPAAAAEACMSALRTAHECGSSSGEQLELMLDKGRTWFELSVSTKAVAAGDKPRFIVLSRDITERKVAEARIARLAYFDSLTGLPNRHAFLERVDRQIRRAATLKETLALLFVDLDGFKNVNDSLGHGTGDLVLQWTAERLREGLRPTDVLSRPKGLPSGGESDDVELARLGGDEFTAMLLDITCPVDAVAVAQRLGQLMRVPFLVEGREITLTASIGIALYPDDGPDAETLVKHADTAMYLAKRSGRDNAQLYSASLTDTVLKRLELDASLRTALDREEFHLVYQPQIDAASGRICAAEALIRWIHPTRGLVAPLEFISLAEENGLIGRVGQWVLRTACGDAARWRRAGQPLRVAVNLSPLQFANADLPQLVIDALAQTGLPPEFLELEITEGALMENSAATRQALHALHEHGVQLALDDFGTGYSSLAYLTRMPLSRIKVDRCFVAGMLDGGENEAIVRAVLAIARSLGLRVTAEGVETLAQAEALKAMDCDSLQGFHFGQPVLPDCIPALLANCWTIGPAGPAIEARSRVQSPSNSPGPAQRSRHGSPRGQGLRQRSRALTRTKGG